MDSDFYDVEFIIKTNKKILLSNDCGFKCHNPIQIYNKFLEDIKINEDNFCKIEKIFIKHNDLYIFIFDSCEDDIIVEIKNIIFKRNKNYISENIKDIFNYDICISINIHENPLFLEKQLQNIL